MKKSLYLGASMLAVSAAAMVPASAADMYRGEMGGYKDAPVYAPANTWTGFYVGAHLGGAWSKMDVKDVDGLNFGSGGLVPFYSLDDTALIGGVQVGYNLQHDRIVYGIEADFGGIGFSKKKDDPNLIGGTFSGIDSGVYGDITGRLGFAFDRALVYAKGGFALYNGEAFVDNSKGGFGGGRANTDTFIGWTIGGGIEYAINPAWSLKAEYQHFDFGTETATLHTPLFGNFRYRNDLTVDSVTFGVNHHFGQGYEPLK